jgi:hypothetical protein
MVAHHAMTHLGLVYAAEQGEFERLRGDRSVRNVDKAILSCKLAPHVR